MAPGKIEREPLPNRAPHMLIFALLSLLVSSGAGGPLSRLAGAFCLDLAFPSCRLLPYPRSRDAVSGVFTTGK